MMDVRPPNEEFEFWLADMDDALDRFLATLPAAMVDRMDYSPESLDTIEEWIIGHFPNTEAMLANSESRIVDGLARYIGETFRHQLGGHWEIRLDDEKYAFYGIPQLNALQGSASPVCPAALATSVADRRSGSYLRSVLQSYL
jgi:hypothetical protein